MHQPLLKRVSESSTGLTARATKSLRSLGLALGVLSILPGAAHAQSWQSFTPFVPFSPTNCLLLTDGTVMCQSVHTPNWWKLTPDKFGDYVNGTWTRLASMPADYGPTYFASAVLADGRVVVMGGEYNLCRFRHAMWLIPTKARSTVRRRTRGPHWPLQSAGQTSVTRNQPSCPTGISCWRIHSRRRWRP